MNSFDRWDGSIGFLLAIRDRSISNFLILRSRGKDERVKEEKKLKRYGYPGLKRNVGKDKNEVNDPVSEL